MISRLMGRSSLARNLREARPLTWVPLSVLYFALDLGRQEFFEPGAIFWRSAVWGSCGFLVFLPVSLIRHRWMNRQRFTRSVIVCAPHCGRGRWRGLAVVV